MKKQSKKAQLTQDWKRTKDGVVSVIYSNQKTHSKSRGHIPPSYSKEEFSVWLRDQPNFDILHKEWVASGYARKLSPSVDRHDDLKPYTFCNIHLTTWRENNAKKNVGTYTDKEVKQYSMDGEFIKEYPSIKQAIKETGALHISCCCTGSRNSAGGFRWEHA